MPDDAIDVASSDTTPSTEVVTVASLVPDRLERGGLIRPAATVEVTRQAFTDYQELTRSLLVDADYQTIGDKKFTKRSGWRKLATAFTVDFEIATFTHTRDDLGRIWRSEFVVRAVAPNGRHVDGYGACSIFDRCQNHWPNCKTGCTRHCGGRDGGCDGFHHFSKPEHDVPATAETRAKNRAAADLFGMGEVSAEEVDGQDPTTKRATWDEINALIATAKDLAKAGGSPNPTSGKYPTIFGVKVWDEYDDGGEKAYSILITSAQAVELSDKIAAAHGALERDANESLGDGGGAASPPPATTSNDSVPETAGEAGTVPEGPLAGEATDPLPADTGVTAATATPAATVEGGAEAAAQAETPAVGAQPTQETSAAPTPAGDGGSTSEPSTAAPGPDAPADTGPGSTIPAHVPPEPSERGQRTRYGMECTGLLKAGVFTADEQHDIIDIITSGRTRSSVSATKDEMTLAITAAKLCGQGYLRVEVDPEEPAAKMLAALIPDGDPTPVEASRGMVFLRKVAEETGKSVAERGDS